MLLLLSAVLPAAHAACEAEPTPNIVGTIPADQAIGVPATAPVGAFVTGDPSLVTVQLVDGAGEVVPAQRSTRAWEGVDLAAGDQFLVLMTPDAPLTEGEVYTLEALPEGKGPDAVVQARFAAGPASDTPPAPPRLEVVTIAEKTGSADCDYGLYREFSGQITGLDDTWATGGLVSVYATWPGGGLDRLIGVHPAPVDGERIDFLYRVPMNANDVGDCIVIVPEGPARGAGEAVQFCAADFPVPRVGSFAGGAGGGCSTVPGSAAPLAGLVVALGALLARRREDDAAG